MEGKMEEFLSFRRIRILRIRLFIHSLPHLLGSCFCPVFIKISKKVKEKVKKFLSKFSLFF